MRNRTLLTIVCVALTGLCGACSMKVTNDGVNVASLPVGAWSFGFQSPQFEFTASLDAELTAKEIIKGAKAVLSEVMTLPILSMLLPADGT